MSPFSDHDTHRLPKGRQTALPRWSIPCGSANDCWSALSVATRCLDYRSNGGHVVISCHFCWSERFLKTGRWEDTERCWASLNASAVVQHKAHKAIKHPQTTIKEASHQTTPKNHQKSIKHSSNKYRKSIKTTEQPKNNQLKHQKPSKATENIKEASKK